MDDVIFLAKNLKKELLDLPLFQEYISVKQEIENSEEIKELKKQIVRAKNENRLDDHKRLVEEYNQNPLVINFTRLKEEAYSYLKEISDILNEK